MAAERAMSGHLVHLRDVTNGRRGVPDFHTEPATFIHNRACVVGRGTAELREPLDLGSSA
jgi:hypothetical protein